MKKIVKKLLKKFTFGSYTKEDMEQQGYLFGLQGMQSYDGVRPLSNFLFTHIKNRFINFKRDHYWKSPCPCKLCEFAEQGKTKHEDGQLCDTYVRWFTKFNKRSKIYFPEEYCDINEMGIEEDLDLDLASLKARIEESLPAHLRSTYFKMVEKVQVNPRLREEVKEFIKQCLKN